MLDRHQERVTDLKFSQDGNLLASSGNNEPALLWDPLTGANLQGYSDGLESPLLLFSPDDTLLALIGSDVVHLARTDVIANICIFEEFGGVIEGAAFSADSKLLAIRILSGILTICDVASCEKIKIISNGMILQSSWEIRDFQANLFWMDDGDEFGIDLSKYNSVNKVPEFLYRIAVCWNAALKLDGRKLLVIWTNELRLLELPSGHLVSSLDVNDYPWDEVLISPALRYFVGKTGNIVEVWSIFQGEIILAYEVHWYCYISGGTFSKDNRFLATPMSHTSVGLWDLRSGKVSVLDCLSSPTVLAFSPSVTCLATGHDDGVVCLWDLDSILKSDTALTRSEFESNATEWLGPSQDLDYEMNIITMPERESIAIAHVNDTVVIRHMTTGRTILVLANLPGMPKAMGYSPIENTLVVSFDDKRLKLYELDYGTEIKQVRSSESAFFIIISNNGRHLLVCTRISIELRSASSLELVHSFQIYRSPYTAISNDSKLLAIAVDRVAIRVWDLTECKELFVIGLSSPLTGLTFSTDSSMIAYAAEDSRLTLYDIVARKIIWTIHFDKGVDDFLSFSSNNILLAVCSIYKAGIKLYNVESGKLICEKRSVPSLEEMKFSADGSYIDTQLGQLKLTSLFPEAKTFKQFTDAADVEEGYFVLGKWLMKGSKRLLWLPPEHRGERVVVQGKSIAIGSSQDRLTMLRIEAYQPEPW